MIDKITYNLLKENSILNGIIKQSISEILSGSSYMQYLNAVSVLENEGFETLSKLINSAKDEFLKQNDRDHVRCETLLHEIIQEIISSQASEKLSDKISEYVESLQINTELNLSINPLNNFLMMSISFEIEESFKISSGDVAENEILQRMDDDQKLKIKTTLVGTLIDLINFMVFSLFYDYF